MAEVGRVMKLRRGRVVGDVVVSLGRRRGETVRTDMAELGELQAQREIIVIMVAFLESR